MKYFFLSLILFSTNQFASTKADMQSILGEIPVLLKYIKPSQKMESKVIKKSLKTIEKKLNTSKHSLLEKSPTFSSNIKFFKQNIQNIYNSIKLDHSTYTKSELKRFISSCINCHSQLPVSHFKKISSPKTKELLSSIKNISDQAVLKYMLRDYRGAIKLFNSNLYNIKKTFKQEKSILQILKIYIVNLNDKPSALEFLNQLNLKTLVFKDRERISNWKKDLSSWINQEKKSKNVNTETLVKKHLTSYEEELQMGNSMHKEINLLVMQQRLQQNLLKQPKSAQPLGARSLYWLGIIENSSPELYSLGDLYLKNCITLYPRTNYAKKAYNAYKKSVHLGYSGSNGTNIPMDIQSELDDLKKLIEEN